jgi:hypothetical protein
MMVEIVLVMAVAVEVKTALVANLILLLMDQNVAILLGMSLVLIVRH